MKFRLFLFFGLLLAIFACRKEEELFDDPSARLRFSTDSVSFDTVFTTLGSITENFRVFNPYNERVNISSIRLVDGDNSPFRINVDGLPGASHTNVEIAENDSIFVFVEVTIDPMDQDNPFFVEDEIEFTINGNRQTVKLIAYGQDAYYIIANTRVQGLPPYKIIAAEGVDTTWQKNRPIVVYGYAVVDSRGTLRIDAGTKIYFHNNGGLWVFRGGTIKVNGTKEEPVLFRGDRLEERYEDIPGQWDRIWINDSSLNNEINYAIIKNSFIGIQAEVLPFLDPPFYDARLKISNTVIQNCSGFGLFSTFYNNLEAENLLISNCGQYDVAITGGGNYTFNHCTFANYWNNSSRETPLFFVQNHTTNALNTRIIDTPHVNVNNSIVFGRNENEYDFEVIQNGAIDVVFRNSILKTDKNTSDANRFINLIKNPADILFVDVNEEDYHLNANGAAVNAGDPTIGATIPLDLDGVDRTLDGQPDLGAYELVP